ncbi:hypothetical protein [Streptosporangium sp. NPDC087985]|uniref:glycosyltransferase n=1 Tax=Streptosporangium sp. NPDC087985 TaxID=3366196 RepID=UPI003813AA81
MSEVPPHVTELAELRAEARNNRDYAGADALRDEIEAEGWLVRDTGDGFELTPKPPFEVWPTVSSVPVPGKGGRPGDQAASPGSGLVGRSDENEGDPERMIFSQLLWDASLSVSRLDETITPAEHEEPVVPPTVTVGLVVDGWPDDLRDCVRALVAHTEARIICLDLGDVDGAGAVLEELAEEFPHRVEAWHVAETPHWQGGSAGWGESRTKLLELDTSDVHVVMETSTILDGDAITPLVRELADDVVAAGWKGVDPGADGHEWHDAGPGEVRGLLGHLFAVRRDAALAAGGFPAEANYYRNADLEFSLRLPGTLVALGDDLPVHEERHRGYHDVDPGYRDKESRRTYDRVLGLLRDT